MRFTNDKQEIPCPENLLGYIFIIKGKVEVKEKNFFVFLEWASCFHHQLLLEVEQGSFLVPTWLS